MGVVDWPGWRRAALYLGLAKPDPDAPPPATDDDWRRWVDITIRLVPTFAYLAVVRALDLAVVPALVLAVVMVVIVLLLLRAWRRVSPG